MDQHLLVFVTVVEKESFSRAAEALHMTQPAVSQYIQVLENTYGVKLLDRNNKFVRLNKAGEIVYFHAKEILGLYTKMQGLMDDLTNRASGSLSIGASYTFGEYVLPHFIAKLHHEFPLIRPSIVIGNTRKIADLVLRHQLDIGIIEGNLESTQLKIDPFADDQMVVVASTQHRLAWLEGEVAASELEKETWLVREVGSGTREATERIIRELSIAPKEMMEFGSTQLIKESVESGLGISFLSHLAIRKELSLGLLKIVRVKGTPLKRDFSIVLQSAFQTKALEVFVKILRESKGFWNSEEG
ncbi:LysR family transcriptional regulator [Robertmurraya andreesenii]|uniref:DNA-binding transcriptional LysR family regulator n=1 Tax=Anoxybacillus andreesenii TaxID=1325932 RepID=A0ABT9V9G4_9BACL|nr:LysR family transcriptional regulator [Robertmurraya andreesenii]MDQ0157574.1 DNA-binding transcriptional LysR family regulator [Robertmurraya andreesenii]